MKKTATGDNYGELINAVMKSKKLKKKDLADMFNIGYESINNRLNTYDKNEGYIKKAHELLNGLGAEIEITVKWEE
jgi:hypothetical protein